MCSSVSRPKHACFGNVKVAAIRLSLFRGSSPLTLFKLTMQYLVADLHSFTACNSSRAAMPCDFKVVCRCGRITSRNCRACEAFDTHVVLCTLTCFMLAAYIMSSAGRHMKYAQSRLCRLCRWMRQSLRNALYHAVMRIDCRSAVCNVGIMRPTRTLP
jgi:hypothetical protein